MSPRTHEGTPKHVRPTLPATRRRQEREAVDRATRAILTDALGPRWRSIMERQAQNYKFGGQRGQALPFALLVLLVLSLLAASVMTLASSVTRDADRFADGIIQFHEAEGCAAQGVAVVTGWPTAGSYEGPCWVAEQQPDGTVLVRGYAEVEGQTRSVSVVVDRGEVVPRSWAG